MVEDHTVQYLSSEHLKLVSRSCFVSILYGTVVAPNSAPNISSFMAINSRTLSIQWTMLPVENRNGIIRYYVIMLSGDTGHSDNYTSSSTSVNIGLLQPSYTYKFSVAAYTVAIGPFSSLESITMPEDGKS